MASRREWKEDSQGQTCRFFFPTSIQCDLKRKKKEKKKKSLDLGVLISTICKFTHSGLVGKLLIASRAIRIALNYDEASDLLYNAGGTRHATAPCSSLGLPLFDDRV